MCAKSKAAVNWFPPNDAPMKQPHSWRAVFAAPAVIAALSAIGLISALTGDGWRDALSWIGLGAPLAAVAWAMARSNR